MEDAVKGQHNMIQIEDKEKEGFQKNSSPATAWFNKGNMGLFIHFGISAVRGKTDISWGMIKNTPWDEKKQGTNKLTPREYYEQAKEFRPEKFDPEQWLAAAKSMGCTYAVFTTKHHDGYALWPSKFGNFNTGTHWDGTDLVKKYVDACRKLELKCGLYYSPPDWYFNQDLMSFGYKTDGSDEKPHLDFDWNPKVLMKGTGYGSSCGSLFMTKDEERSYKEYIANQVRELLTQYGKIDILWFDGGPECISMEEIRKLAPDTLVNSRMHGYGDFATPEVRYPEAKPDGVWELCDIWNSGGWAYTEPISYRSAEQIYKIYRNVMTDGGNYLINVGPRGDGTLPELAYERFREFESLKSVD